MIQKTLYTTFFSGEEKIPLKGDIYLYGSFEERSDHIVQTSDEYPDLNLIKIEESPNNLEIIINSGSPEPKVMRTYYNLVEKFYAKTVYLDITGLSHSIWAPLLKALLEMKIEFFVIYVEPYDYARSLSSDAQIYDLSEKTRGISPIAGFTNLGNDDGDFIFVPLLGFEGARFLFMVENVDPIASNIYPVVGIPGFRAEYPFYTYECNRSAIKGTGSWKNIIYSAADCPFSLVEEIHNLNKEFLGKNIKIGLIGTKPHALGGVLSALIFPEDVEILHDHPIRKQKRTSGVARKHLWDIRSFLMSDINFSHVSKSGRLARRFS